ncbi:unnamed protein product [Brassicogethes aeneus]|uniref:E3 ubiquitin-protein ligase n=1 Tax=Brassicogethes aeneus TaxID=1431903 RepID=A0A9P0AWN2_BRAAE|nr:unnamed protein product [Brassicogethes aeneus]
MNTILPDQILDQMVCSECSKYLSVLPVLAYPNRTVRCGRCIEEDDGGVPSQVNKVFPTTLFKCVNRYEGCTSLLLPEQVKEHEKNCISRNLDVCPLCTELKMPPYMLLAHFKKCHGNYLLKKPVVQIDGNVDSDEFYLYCTENTLFMLNLSVDTVNGKIFLDNKLVGPHELTKGISQQFRVQEGLFCKNSEVQPCDTSLKKRFEFPLGEFKKLDKIFCELNLNVDAVQFANVQLKLNKNIIEEPLKEIYQKSMINNISCNYFGRKLYLSPKFKQLNPNAKLSFCKLYCIDLEEDGNLSMLFCSFCGNNLYSKPSYNYRTCSEPIVCCQSCNDNISKTCSEGHYPEEYLHFNEFFLNVQAYCKWKCEQYFDSFNLYEHELNCIKHEPIPICPVPNCSSENFKNFFELNTHFNTHKKAILRPYCESKIGFFNLEQKDYYVYLDHVTAVFRNINDERIKLKNLIKTDKSEFKIFVNNTLIRIDEEIEIQDKILKFRVAEDFVVKCKK